MKFHPVADIFPLLQGTEYEELKADIAKNGLIEPIWLHPDGSIIDGRNRWRACEETNTNAHFKTWDGKGSLVEFVLSLNLRRRHLTPSQAAMASVEALPLLEAEARERQREAGGDHLNKLNNSQPLSQKIDIAVVKDDTMGRATQHAAELFGTNRQYVSDAKRIKQEDPELADQVRTGRVTIPQAKREIIRRNRTEPLPVNGKYRVFYADPPWQYNNKGLDDYGHAERHYPSMSIVELCEMGEDIKETCENDAVLFMWVTSPFLEDCFRVIKAWGFEYKTSFVWDKIRHNFGYYNSVRHEFLLICTRGSCTPDVQKLFDSVQSIERSNKHSEKPEQFREIIDTIYPNGNRIELFARKKVNDWETWGNEPTT